MREHVSSSSPRGLTLVGLSLLTAVLTVFAVRADLVAYPDRYVDAVLDAVVGVAFVVSAVVARGLLRQRLLIGAVGPIWLAASFAAWARSLPQALLLVALLAFPAARLGDPVRVVLAAVSVPIALQVVPQVWVGVTFAGAAVATALLRATRPGSAADVYPPAASGLVAGAVLLSAFQRSAGVAPSFATYAVAFLAVAVGFPLAAAAAARARSRLTEALLEGHPRGGLAGLTEELRRMLADPSLTVTTAPENPPPPGDLLVQVGGGQVASVSGQGDWRTDPPTAAAVADAIRLSVAHDLLLAEQDRRLTEVLASRARLLTVLDDERARVARELEARASPPLAAAHERLRSLVPPAEPDAAQALQSARTQLAAARGQLTDIVSGVPPTALGDGRLGTALSVLVQGAPVPVGLDLDVDADGDEAAESALYYACSEALTNAIKHADPQRLDVRLERGGDDVLVLTVTDDGSGGADPNGSGLRGLADRLSARGGELSVESVVGGGTRVVATVPCRAPSPQGRRRQEAGTAGTSALG